ncbi:RES domain protein [Clostridium puniceum]|uniref:RES domain protein n=2 Tax=Clostridium puniceum TaxID=29367 RepID=A0A1S8TPZ4_9CLOT|nr:RES domain protein [Clostridium puniceum]
MKILGEHMYKQITSIFRILKNERWDEQKGAYFHKERDWMLRTESIAGVMEDYGVFNGFEWEKVKEITEKIFHEYDNDIDVLGEFCSKYSDYEEYNSYLGFNWKQFSENVKYYGRFNNKQNYEMLKKFDKLIKEFTISFKDKSMYRARINVRDMAERDKNKYGEILGPAPSGLCKENRLSPKGISYMYLAESINTALAECRAITGDKALIGEFVPKRELFLFDLSKDDFCHSIFDENFDGMYDCYALVLQKISKEISRPIGNNEDTLKYIPSQVFAEYIRDKGLDGIIYKSSLSSKKNYVLFYGADESNKFVLGSKIPCFKEIVELKDYQYVKILPLDIKYVCEKTLPFMDCFDD